MVFNGGSQTAAVFLVALLFHLHCDVYKIANTNAILSIGCRKIYVMFELCCKQQLDS